MSTDDVIRARALTKRYGSRCAVDAIDFDVHRGECLGFLGPNGAGKSTVMRMLYGFTPRTSGELRVFDLDVDEAPRRIKARLGVVPQDNNLDPDNTVWENLRIYGRYFRLSRREVEHRAARALELFALDGRRDAQIDELSGGMKRRLVMARALLGGPEVVLLDEPTTGLDPHARRVVWRTLRELRRAGRTLVLTTHYLDEAERLCDRVMLVDHGSIVVTGTPHELIADHAGAVVWEADFDNGRDTPGPVLQADIAQELSRRELDHVYDDATLTVYAPGRDTNEVASILGSVRLPNGVSLAHRRGTLEDVFLRITGHALVEGDGE